MPAPHGISARASILVLVAALAGCATTAPPGPTPEAPMDREAGAFIVRIGSDTLAVERFARTPTQLTGEMVVRSPQTALRSYTASLRPDGSISRFEIAFSSAAPAAQPTQRATVEFGVDSATVVIQRGDSTQRLRVSAPGMTIPQVANSYALYEQALIVAVGSGADPFSFGILPLGAPRRGVASFAGAGGSMLLTNIAGVSRVETNARGRLLALDGSGSTLKVMVERVPAADVRGLAAEFLRRDETGRGVGTLSPLDSVVGRIGKATLAVTYGRPSRRGRKIMGNVVPWNQVWRTGANQATTMRTDTDLMIGGTRVPAGSYTLFTLPSETGWKLIVNRQVGQWGTTHDPSLDLARIDMKRETVGVPVERFTISIEPGEDAGTLALTWDDTRVSVPVRVAPR